MESVLILVQSVQLYLIFHFNSTVTNNKTDFHCFFFFLFSLYNNWTYYTIVIALDSKETNI